jgi:hypothetical protein
MGKGPGSQTPCPIVPELYDPLCSNHSYLTGTDPHFFVFEQANTISPLLQQKLSTVGFCATEGCKFAATGLYAINGITRSPFASNDTFYVAHTLLGGVSLFTRQSDNRLLLDEHIKTGKHASNVFS